MVARAQASGLYADRSAVERGTIGPTARQNEFIRLFTALGSYMFAKFNVANEVYGRTKRDIADQNKSSFMAGLRAASDMTMLFTVEAIAYNAIKGSLPGMGDDEGGEEDEGWAEFLAKETVYSIMSTMPGIRDASAAIQGFSGGGAYSGISETFGRAVGDIGDLFSPEDRDFGDLRSINDMIGIVAVGYPSTAAWRALEGSGAINDEEASLLAMILGR